MPYEINRNNNIRERKKKFSEIQGQGNKTAPPATTISNPTTLTNTKETLEHAKRKLDFEEEKENQQQKKGKQLFN